MHQKFERRTEHNVTSADEDDIEIIRSTHMNCSRKCVNAKYFRRRLRALDLSIGISLHGSIDGRREDIPEPLRSDPRRSEGLRLDMMLREGRGDDNSWYKSCR